MNSVKRISTLRGVVLRRSLSSIPKWDHDVLICGGGVVGAALAADVLMRSKGTCNVGLIELAPPRASIRTSQDPPDVRVYAMAPNSIKILERIGAWKYIAERSHPYSNMQVWEQSGPGLLKFSATDMDAAELGRICEDQTIQSAIYQAIKDQGYEFTTYYGYSVDDLKLPSNAKNPSGAAVVSIKPKDPSLGSKQLSARLVVGADGANSAVRRLSGISTWGWGYGQEAVVATIRVGDRSASSTPSPAAASSTVAPAGNTADTATASASAATHEQPLGNAPDSEALYNAASSESPPAADGARRRRPFVNNTAWQKYLPTGPLAVLPLWDEYASIVWSTGIADAKRLKALPEAEFLAELNTALQTPPDTDKWSVFEKTDGSNLPPFLGALFGSKPFGPVSSALSQSPLQLLQRVKQEAAAVADTLMSAAQLGDPLSYPPRVTTVCGPRVSFPLNFSQASQYSAPRCALIGDAAHSIHPQAGQGLNLGILDAVTLSDSIVRTLQVGGDIGNATVLQEYERERYVKNLGMMTLVDGINRVFKDGTGAQHKMGAGAAAQEAEQALGATKVRPERLEVGPKLKQFLRSAGMLGIHQLGPVKSRIAKFAMGVDSK